MDKVNLAAKLGLFEDLWRPRIVGAVNDAYVKLVKLKGEFVWHRHEEEDELFLVLKGHLRLRLRDREIPLDPGELFVVPRGVDHMPVADEEVHALLLEPKSTVNTGDAASERTVTPEWI